MKIVNPPKEINGISPENFYYALDDNNLIQGYGYIVVNYKPYFSDSFPLNIQFKIKAENNVKNQLLGAIMAKSYQTCYKHGFNSGARIYTEVSPDKVEDLKFYTSCGLENNDRDELIQIRMPGPARQNLSEQGFYISEIPLNQENDIYMLANRLNSFQINSISPEKLMECKQSKNFYAIAMLTRNNTIAGECLMFGNDNRATLASLYVIPSLRRMGIAKEMIRTSMFELSKRGVSEFYTILKRRSQSQRSLAKACSYRAIKTISLYPGISINQNNQF